MRINPVKFSDRPAYPLQQIVLEHPTLLSRLPLRWQRCRKAAVAAGMLGAMVLSGCSSPKPGVLVSSPLPSPVMDAPSPAASLPPVYPVRESHISLPFLSPDHEALAGKFKIQPFVSERSALEYLKSVASQYHLDMSESGITDIKGDAAFVSYGYDSNLQALSGNADIDLYDAGRRIGFDYVDSSESQAPLPFASGSDDSRTVDKSDSFILVIQGSQDKDQIRQQVTAFLNWLKSEGII